MPLTRITAETLAYQQITMANSAQVVKLLIQLYNQGVKSTAQPVLVNGTPDWQITISQPGYVDQIGNLNDWIVTGFQGRLGGSEVHIYPNGLFQQVFSDDTPTVWAATSTAPKAVAAGGGIATIFVPPPNSPNGPWTYTISQTDTTAGTAAAPANTSGAPGQDSSGNLVFTVSSGLTVGHVYTFTVTASTKYADVPAVTSLASNAITATN